ncbi:MAG: type II secretion system F family protein [Fibrobacteres bacterium]|nr:type II secretion system F family protein [Fibrobacterota bacterium]
MVDFQYVCINQARERVSGAIKANDTDEAVKSLQAKGFMVVSLKVANEAGVSAKSTLADRMMLLADKIQNRVPSKSVVFFTRQLSTMFSAGMTLERSLDMLAKSEPHPRFKKALQHIAGEIKKGHRLSEAFAGHPAIFDRLYIALIKSGEIGGTLGPILSELADHLEKSEDIKRKVVAALYYPVIVLLFLVLCVAILMLKVAPMFADVYKSFGANLPAPTMVLMSVSNMILDHVFISFILTLILLTIAVVISQTDKGRLQIDQMKLRMPVFGSLIKDSIMARFSRSFSLLMSSSVPVLDSLALVAHAMTNVVIEKAVLKARESISRGRPVYSALEESRTFPDILVRLAETGEETGELDKLMLKGAEFYEKQVDALIQKITSIIEPFLIILMAVVVGALVIIIYLPIFNLGMAIRKGMH